MTERFTDRLYYLDGLDTVAHCQYVTSGRWVCWQLEVDGEWDLTSVGDTFADVFNRLRSLDPNLLLEETWA